MATQIRTDASRSSRAPSGDLGDRLPPQNIEAEQAVIGSLLIDPQLCDDVVLMLRPDDFYSDANRKLFEHIVAMHDSGGRIDMMLLVERLRQAGDFDAIGGAGYLADAIGPKKTIIATLVLWLGVVVLAAAATTKPVFWGMAALAAIGMGSTQAVGRSFMSQITPPSRESEFFGFYSLSGKFASMFGPLIFGSVSAATGSQRLAVLSLLPLFLLGLGFMLAINEARARAAAHAESCPGNRA